jgi:RNA polymerase-binding transcription factor DksA
MPEPKDSKEKALAALEIRKEKNKTRKRVDNSSLYAGSPMYFDCASCGAEISVPEDYITRPDLCGECQDLRENGWLE